MSRICILLLALGALARPAIAGEPSAALIKLNTGITLQYVVQGPAEGTPIVMLHGIDARLGARGCRRVDRAAAAGRAILPRSRGRAADEW